MKAKIFFITKPIITFWPQSVFPPCFTILNRHNLYWQNDLFLISSPNFHKHSYSSRLSQGRPNYYQPHFCLCQLSSIFPTAALSAWHWLPPSTHAFNRLLQQALIGETYEQDEPGYRWHQKYHQQPWCQLYPRSFHRHCLDHRRLGYQLENRSGYYHHVHPLLLSSSSQVSRNKRPRKETKPDLGQGI